MNLLKDAALFSYKVLNAPYRVGARVADALEVKEDDSNGTKIAKSAALAVGAPVAAAASLYVAATAISAATVPLAQFASYPLLHVLQTAVFSPYVGGLVVGAATKIATSAVAAYIAVTGFAGMSKDIKKNVGVLTGAVAEKSQKSPVKFASSVAEPAGGISQVPVKGPGEEFNTSSSSDNKIIPTYPMQQPGNLLRKR